LESCDRDHHHVHNFFKFGKRFHHGGFGDIHRCIEKKTGNEYAVKVVSKWHHCHHIDAEHMNHSKREVHALRKLQDRWVARPR
jgi:hypothetical protein